MIAMSVTALPAHAATGDVGLGTVGGYAVLGGQSVVNTGPSILHGDLGVSPGSAVVGFPPGLATGATHSADAAALQAQSDLTTAYDDAAGRAPTATIAGDLVGQTLTAGVYASSGPIGLSQTLTLDGQGDPDAVFVFQVASTLITASSSTVSLVNGAQACHVYWQVGSSATLGTTSSFTGTLMASTSVTVTTGATIAGRALAGTGSVTLDNNVVTEPACATTPPPSTSTTTASAPTSSPAAPSPTSSGVPSTTTAAAGPTATGLSPEQGPVAGGTTITVTGTGLVPGQTSVSIGGVTLSPADVDVTSSTSMTFTSPPHRAGPVSVRVTTPSGTSRAQTFTYRDDLVGGGGGTPTTAGSPSALPQTGEPSASLLWPALALLLAGYLLLASAHRHRGRHRSPSRLLTPHRRSPETW